jgi:hypothetical protein
MGLAGAGAATWASGLVAPDPRPYLDAQSRGRFAQVAGSVSGDPPRPGGLAVPLDGVSVLLMPHSAALETELRLVRDRYRQTSRAYLEAAEQIEGLRRAYESSLQGQGGGLLVRGEVSDAEGKFRFTQVPAGAWLVLAWLSEHHRIAGRHLPAQDAGTFVGNVERTGYTAVTYWLLRIDLEPGAEKAVRLTERGAWLTAIREDRREPPPRSSAPGPRRDRRQDTTR